MLILNFSHPLTPTHLEQIQALTGEAVGDVKVTLRTWALGDFGDNEVDAQWQTFQP